MSVKSDVIGYTLQYPGQILHLLADVADLGVGETEQ